MYRRLPHHSELVQPGGWASSVCKASARLRDALYGLIVSLGGFPGPLPLQEKVFRRFCRFWERLRNDADTDTPMGVFERNCVRSVVRPLPLPTRESLEGLLPVFWERLCNNF